MSPGAALVRRRAPFFRQRRGAVAPVVGTVLVAAITVVLAAVLFVMVSNMLTPPPPPPVAITFTNGGWDNGTNRFTVLIATGVAAIPASSLQFHIQSSEGTLVYVGQSNTTVTFESVDITVLYLDADTGDRITAGDGIEIRCEPISGYTLVDGGAIEIYYGNQQVAVHAIA